MSSVTVSSVANAQGVTTSAVASVTNIASNVPTSPTAAIAQGQKLLDQTLAMTSSLAGVLGGATAIVQALPAGQIQTAVKDAQSILSDVSGGASAGATVFGIYGAAIGATIGALIGIFNDVMSSPPDIPEGEFRSSAEQMCFPSFVLAGQNGVAAPPTPLALPACWSDIRGHIVQYQTSADGGDSSNAGSGQNGPTSFTIGTGWVPPPYSTKASQIAAWYLANAWMSQNSISKANALKTGGNPAALADEANNAYLKARTNGFAGDDQQAQAALALVSRWYGQTFETNASTGGISGPGGNTVTNDGIVSIPPEAGVGNGNPNPSTEDEEDYVHQFSSYADILNTQVPLDYTYYISKSWCVLAGGGGKGGSSPVVGPAAICAGMGQTYGRPRLTALPDTLLCGLAEIAALVQLGSIPSAGGDLIAFHYALSLAWTWQSAQQEDAAIPWQGSSFLATSPQGTPEDGLVQMHPNFARVVGILQSKLQGKVKGVALPSGVAAATSTNSSTPTAAVQAAENASGAAVLAELNTLVTHPANSPTATVTSASGAKTVVVPGQSLPTNLVGVASATLAGAALLGAVWWKKRARSPRAR
jgi:hypothetical protein